jgi:RNA polymerase sigma-70 factor (ECF subfamily)
VKQIDAPYLQELLDAHGAALTLYARQFSRSPEDALQEALIQLLRQDPTPHHPVAWLYKTVRRRALNIERAESRRLKHHRQAGEQQESWFLPDAEAPDEALNLERLLAQLPQLDREIVVARIWGDFSFSEIAELVHRPLSSVHRTYQNALATLAQMADQQPDPSRPRHEPRPSVT